MAAHQKIVEAAMQLRAAAPERWEAFVMAVREYAATTTSGMLRCDQQELVGAQGMARQANEFSNIMMNAPQLYEQAQNAKRTPKNG